MTCPICGFTGVIFFHNTIQKYQYCIEDKLDYIDCSLEYCEKCDHIHNYSFKEEWLDEIYNDQPTPSVPISDEMTARTDHVLEWIGYDFYNKKNIMEIGGGDGSLTYLLSKHAKTVTLFEPNKGINNRKFLDNVTIVNEFYNGQYIKYSPDLIIFKQVLEHVYDIRSFISNISSILSKDGMVYCEIPLSNFIIDNVATQDIHAQHIHYFSMISVVKLFNLYGLNIFKYHLIKNGHDIGLLFGRSVSYSNVSISDNKLSSKSISNFEKGAILRGSLLQYFDSENIILYGATANALWALRHANSIAYIHDDNKILGNYSMYRKKSIIPIKNKFIFDDCASNIILITAYLHDDNIVKKIKLRNKNCMEIYTINPSKFMNNLNNNVVKKL
jgi:hypothetical protein